MLIRHLKPAWVTWKYWIIAQATSLAHYPNRCGPEENVVKIGQCIGPDVWMRTHPWADLAYPEPGGEIKRTSKVILESETNGSGAQAMANM